MIRIKQFEPKESENALNTEGSSVDEVTVEQIWIRFRRKPVFIKNVHKIKELSMNVSADCELAVVRDLHVN